MVKTLADNQKLQQLRSERSLVLLKPDAVKRQIVGELITRFERKGLKICGLKMVLPTEELVSRHYTDSEQWLKDSGERTYNSYIEKGIEPPMSARDLALNTRHKLMKGLLAGPLVALVLQGAHVIEIVRKMRGATSPQVADVGTIGFDYSVDSYELADAGDWPIRNIIHASDSAENAEQEINIWFKKNEILDYTSAIEHILYSKEWSK